MALNTSNTLTKQNLKVMVLVFFVSFLAYFAGIIKHNVENTLLLSTYKSEYKNKIQK